MFPRSERRGTPADLLVVGLGNPGAEFAGTLHNVGADAVELVASRAGAALRAEKGLQARTCTVTLGERRVALAVPTTYMNDSGTAVRGLAKRFGIEDPSAMVIVHDELDLAPGTVRVKVGGGLAGHNGLRSLQAHLHTTDFVRVRIGVGKPPSAAQGANHVLKRPPAAVRALLEVSTAVAADAVERIARDGIDAAMQACNSLP
jgi:peptidyl-tRNA hydrolase, PTH1 family